MPASAEKVREFWVCAERNGDILREIARQVRRFADHNQVIVADVDVGSVHWGDIDANPKHHNLLVVEFVAEQTVPYEERQDVDDLGKKFGEICGEIILQAETYALVHKCHTDDVRIDSYHWHSDSKMAITFAHGTRW